MYGITFLNPLQAGVEEKRGKEFQGSAAEEGEPTIVAFSSLFVGFVCDCSEGNVGIGAKEI